MTRLNSITALMKFFRTQPLRRKIISVFIVSSVCILGLTGTIIAINEIYSAREIFISDSEGLVRTIGKNSAAALLFHDRTDALETIRVLRVFPDVRYASIMDKGGVIFAEYQRDDTHEPPDLKNLPQNGSIFSASNAQFSQDVTIQKEIVGKVYMVRDLTRFYSSLCKNIGIMMLAIAASLMIGYFLSLFLQKIVTDPIHDLVQVMKTVTVNKQYSLRADIPSKDEIGDLARGFNEMLEKIEKRDAELTDHRQHLEQLVRRRTEELIRLNEDLVHELEERKKFESALQESERWYRAIFENTGNASIIVQEDMIISHANAEFIRMLGYQPEEIIGKMPWTNMVHPDYVQGMVEYHTLRRLGRRAPSDYDVKVVDKSGKPRDVHITVGLLPDRRTSIASVIDLTESKALEEQLSQSQKMEAVGQLAAGVAHDFNNILTAIIGYGSLLQMRFGADDPERSYADSILNAAHRAASLTQSLLAFGRKQVISPKKINFNDAIKNMEGLLRRMIGEDIELRCVYSGLPITILADAGQIGQVIMNLGANARDAMPGGGILTVETSVIDLNNDHSMIEKHLAPGSYALLKVTDVGQGMSREITERIFEPFFTMKGMGKGTGLGLSIVYGIVTQHSGHINVHSEPGKGTVFSIYFPALPIGQPEQADIIPENHSLEIHGKETILLAEDDDDVREYILTILKQHGYSIIDVSDGEEALKKFEGHQDNIDLLLLDVVMPKVNGKMVFDRVQRIKPGAKAIFMSGYTADIIHKKGLREEGINFIAKPVDLKELTVKIREVLDP
ncbi:MAG: PAS domain S-box protein [Syntrophorhabdaceae bacterium]